MLLDNILLKFHGFHPSDFTRLYLNEKMRSLKEESPHGSNVQVTFTRKDQIFKGIVTINSSAGKFFAVASGAKIKEVTHKLIEQIRKQLSRWKSKRFQRESLRGLSSNIEKTEKSLNYDSDIVA